MEGVKMEKRQLPGAHRPLAPGTDETLGITGGHLRKGRSGKCPAFHGKGCTTPAIDGNLQRGRGEFETGSAR